MLVNALCSICRYIIFIACTLKCKHCIFHIYVNYVYVECKHIMYIICIQLVAKNKYLIISTLGNDNYASYILLHTTKSFSGGKA